MFNNVSVFFRPDGSICDPWDSDVHVCATFAIGGLIINVCVVAFEIGDLNASNMRKVFIDTMTLSEPITSVDQVRDAVQDTIDCWEAV